MLVLLAAALMAYRQRAERAKRPPASIVDDARYYARQDVRRFVGTALMLMLAAGLAIGSTLGPIRDRVEARFFARTWVAVATLVGSLLALALADWLATRSSRAGTAEPLPRIAAPSSRTSCAAGPSPATAATGRRAPRSHDAEPQSHAKTPMPRADKSARPDLIGRADGGDRHGQGRVAGRDGRRRLPLVFRRALVGSPPGFGLGLGPGTLDLAGGQRVAQLSGALRARLGALRQAAEDQGLKSGRDPAAEALDGGSGAAFACFWRTSIPPLPEKTAVPVSRK